MNQSQNNRKIKIVKEEARQQLKKKRRKTKKYMIALSVTSKCPTKDSAKQHIAVIRSIQNVLAKHFKLRTNAPCADPI
jgi:thioredoxin-related protein